MRKVLLTRRLEQQFPHDQQMADPPRPLLELGAQRSRRMRLDPAAVSGYVSSGVAKVPFYSADTHPEARL